VNDEINNPIHYTSSNAVCSQCKSPIQCIDVVRHLDFNIGNAIKYLWRWETKGGVKDLKKSIWYITDKINQLEKIRD
jgi:hypothetical protein